VRLRELSDGIPPAVNEAMPHRLILPLGFLLEHAGARHVGVLLADYELRGLPLPCSGEGEQLTLPVEAGDGVFAEPRAPV